MRKTYFIHSLFLISLISWGMAQTNIQTFTGNVNIAIQQGTNSALQFRLSVQKDPTQDCGFKECLVGWIDSYGIENDKESFVGGFNGQVNEKLQAQPVFQLKSNQRDYSIDYPVGLTNTWVQIIRLYAQVKDNYNGPDQNLRNQPLKQQIPVQDIKLGRSILTSNTLFNQNKLSSLNSNYEFALVTQSLKEQNLTPAQDLAGTVGLSIKFERQFEDSSNIIERIKSILSNKGGSITETPEDAKKARISNNQYFKENPPVDCGTSFDQKHFFPNEVKGVDVAKYLIDSQQYKKDYGVTDTTVPVSDATSNTNAPTGGRLLQTSTYTLLNLIKTLYSKTILGHLFQVKLQAYCTLTVVSSGHTITCNANLIYTAFGSTKTVSIYSFSKSVSLYWTWSHVYSGSWAFNFVVPLPPPVSFITINFYVNVGYTINLNVVTQTLPGFYPYRYQAKATAQTSLTTNSRASLRVIAIEGGVYIKGTLVSVKTQPSVTLSYYFFVRTINILVEWYLQILAFSLEWGFFWRYWTFWSGWSGDKIIAKWTINGIYQKYTLVNTNWNIKY